MMTELEILRRPEKTAVPPGKPSSRRPLPSSRLEAPESDPAPQSEPRGGVLVVDDNDDVRELLGLALTCEGFDVRTASNGREALELFLTFRPRAAIVDIGMPGMDGFEVARRVREAGGQLEDVMLVALTGYSHQADPTRAERAGFDLFVTKPPDLDKLIEWLRARL